MANDGYQPIEKRGYQPTAQKNTPPPPPPPKNKPSPTHNQNKK